MIIGVTGTSGAGKTLVSSIIEKNLKYKVINADEIVKKMSIKGQKYYNEIIKVFGKEILDNNEEINKKKFANIIFEKEDKRRMLNDITFKYVVEEIKKLIEKDCIIDAPLLFEAQLENICDITIAVLAEEETKLKRICKRDKTDMITAKKRLKSQKVDNYYKNKANYIIENNDRISEIEEQVEKILKKERGKKHV